MRVIRAMALGTLGLGLFLTTGCVAKSKYVKEQNRANTLESQLNEANKAKQDLANQLQTTQQSAEELGRQKNEQDQLVNTLTNEIQSDQVKISEIAGKVSINMVDKILFDSGSAHLKANGEKVLQKVGDAVSKIHDKRIWVGGHTDNIPISASLRDKFASNWELSSARATAVARFLEEKAGIPGDRLLAVGLGQYQPIGDNKLPEGRAENRRIEILLIPTQETLKSIQH
jgi:chemotaxis protein MotB